MAKKSPLTAITDKAKALKKRHPHKFDHMRKRDRWPKGYIREAAKSVKPKAARKKHTVGAKRKPQKRKVSAARKPKGKHLVRYVEKSSTERVMSGRRKKKCHCSHRAYLAGSGHRRRRSVGGIGSTGLLVGLGVGALAIYLLTKKSAPTAPLLPAQLPPIAQTSNYNRNQQSQDLVNYALAAGIGIDAITNLINSLNKSSDTQVSNIYDTVNTTGDVSALLGVGVV